MSCGIISFISIRAAFLLLLVDKTSGGVAPVCQKGTFYDNSKQRFVSCRQCISEQQACFPCCKTNTQEAENDPTLSTLRGHSQTQGSVGKKAETTPRSFLPNILVVSTISVFLLICLVILLLVIIKTITERTDAEGSESNCELHYSEEVNKTESKELKAVQCGA